MKKILTLVLVSVLGGIITLSAYKLFLEQDNSALASTTNNNEQVSFLPTNNTVTSAYNISNVPDFVDAAEKTVHAVVHVKNTTIVKGPTSFEDLFYGRNSQRAQVGTGSGVIISPDGYIITNNHVINGANQISITSNDNKIYDAKLIGSDEKTDIALLKIDTDEELPFVTFGDSDQAKIGEWVLAVGNPFNLTSTVTAGIISAKSRDLTGQNHQSFIQTDAAVNPGNSGGALVNANGDLVGINTAISSQTGSYIGYSFAVPSNIARKVVEDIMEYGDVQNGILGVTGGSLNSKYAEELGVATTEGFYVNSVEEDSGADLAGIQSGDVIKKLDDIKISKFSDLKGYLSTKRPDDVVNVTLLRDNDTKIVPVTLIRNQTLQLPIIGLVKNAKEKDLRKLDAQNGVKISSLDKTYERFWKKNGIEEGSIVTAINDKSVNSIDEVKHALENKSSNDPLKFEIINKNGKKESFYWK
ncbi:MULTISPECIES: trypsin-like peptidase domain-containing protein [Flavobacteriaceae]|uniref:Do family serine endopeptidase n=2 Tax=Flavobacteriaceae TaxID=49546 RepID=A0ABN1JUH1_9FLAO|nr:trypsin-like peptidase domain-containing protein [Meridianimaribacter flavus]TDY12658.1 Do/DeqQ family serine protease [Meridianimaribacter flavus]